jgi:hypothetical protein
MIYTRDDFEERLSELAIGTEDATILMEFVDNRMRQIEWQHKRLSEAYRIIGSNVIDECVEYD